MTLLNNELRVRYLIGGALAALLCGLLGCPPNRPEPEPPVVEQPVYESPPKPLYMIIDRVNQNSRKMDFLLRLGGVSAKGEFTDRNGHTEKIQANGAGLFRKPRDLYLKLQPTWGVLELGSNEEEFWVWEKFDKPRYFWGEHAYLEGVMETDVPLRPDHLVEVLGLNELPVDTTGPEGPLVQVGSDRYVLIFLKQDRSNQRFISKKLAIDRKPPFLIRSVTYYTDNGQAYMTALLEDYRSIEGSEVLAPHLIKMAWLQRDSWVDLKFATMERFDSERAETRFTSPRQKDRDIGRMIRIDDRRGAGDRIEEPGDQDDS